MAQSQINLGVALNFDDSQYKSGVKSVEQSLKKFSTTPAFVKLKLDDTDFRKQYQGILADLQKKVQKTGALNYKTTKGKAKVADSIGTIQAAYKYNLEQSQNTKLSTAEINTYKKREEVLRQYLNLLKLVGQETKRNAQLEKERANMGVRMEKARMTGKVAAERQRAYKAEFADEREAKKADELFRRRWAHEFQQWNKNDAELAKLQRDADARARAAAGEYNRQLNRVASGGNTSSDLADMRRYYQEQERLAEQSSKRQEQQFKNRVKAKRNAANIETAIDNERLARDNARAAAEKTNANRTEKNIRAEIKALKDLKKAEDELDRAQGKRARNKNQNSATNQRIRSLQQEAQIVAQETKRAAEVERLNKMYIRQGNLLSKLGSLATRYFSIYSIINFGKKIAEITGYFQQQQVALEGILGSASEAQRVINEVKNMALESPMQTKELITYAKQLSAFGIESKDLLKITSSLADISVGLGVDMNRIILAYGQVKSASVLRGQELRQFTEAGIPMVKALADKLTILNGELVTTADVFELISKRQVSFEIVADVLNDMTKEGGRFYKMQEQVTNTLAGQMSKLRDLWTISLEDMGKEGDGLFVGVVKALQLIVKNAKSVTSALLVMIPLSVILRQITKMKMEFALLNAEQQKIAGNWRKFAWNKSGLKGGLAGIGITLGVSAIIGVATKVYDSMTKVQKKMNEVRESFTKDTNKMIEGVDSLFNKLRSFSYGSQEWKDAFDTLKLNYSDYIDVNDSLIKALNSENNALDQQAEKYKALNEQIAAGIRLRQQIEMMTSMKSEASNLLLSRARGDFWESGYKAYSSSYIRSLMTSMGGIPQLNAAFGTNYTDVKRIEDRLSGVYERAFSMFIKEGKTSVDEFIEVFKTSFSTEFMGSQFKEGTDLMNNLIANSKSIFQVIENTKEFDNYKEQIKEFLEANSAASSINRIRDLFSDAKKELKSENRIDQYDEKQGWFRDVFLKTQKNTETGTVENVGIMNELYQAVNSLSDSTEEEKQKKTDAKSRYNALVKVIKDETTSAKQVADAIKQLRDAMPTGELRTIVSEVYNLYTNSIDLLTSQEFELANRLEAISEFKQIPKRIDSNGMEFVLQDYFESWNPKLRGQETLQQTRAKIEAEYSELIKEKKGYESERTKQNNQSLFTDEIAIIDAKIKVLKKIAEEQYYDVNLSDNDKSRNRYERLRITDFFAEMLSLIKKAEDATEKIVGVTGYTEQLDAFVNELGEGNFLKEFFVEGGNPFKKLMDEFKDYGVTEFLPDVNEEKLKTIFRQAGWEEGKELSVPDFQAMYKQAIEVLGAELLESLKAKAKALPDGAEKNSINSAIKQLQERVVSATKELETRWGDQEIESKLLEMIKGLTDINSNLTKIREKNDLFERVAKASNYITAQEAIYGKGSKYKSFVGSGYTSDAILQMLQSEGGQGVASTNAGIQLKELVKKSGDLNISNLTQLVDIMHDLEEQAAVMSVTAETTEAKRNAEQFKKVTGQFSEQIKKLCDDIINELEALKAARTEGMVGRDKIDTANTNYKNSMTAIENALKNGTIKDKGEADKMRLQATQNLYNELLEALGGEGMPKWAMNLFGDNGSLSGISDLGKTLNSMFGGKSLQDLVSQGIADKYQAGGFGEAGSEEAMLKAGEAASSAASAIALVDLIIKAIYETLSFATKLGTQIIDWMEKTNDVTSTIVEKADGTFKRIGSASDFDYTNDMQTSHTEKYDSDKLARQKAALQAAQTFNQHIMDGWDKLKSGDIFGATFEAIAAFGDLIVDIFAISDSTREATIQNYLHDIDRMEKALDTLDFRASFMSGLEALDEQSKKLDVLREQQEAYEKSWNEENAKRSSSQEKLDEYQDGATEKFREQLELIKSMKEGIMGTADALADNLSNALVNAFKQGKNAAREWKDALKSYIGEVMQQMLINKVFGTQLDKLMDQWMYGFTDSYDSKGNLITAEQKAAEKYGEQTDEVMAERLGDSKLAKQFYKSGIELGDYLIEYIEGLPEDAKNFMFGTTGTTALSGGISGITEDTARQLEGLNNSMLIQLIAISQYLSYMSNSGFAQVQVSWFNDMLSQTRMIQAATSEMNKAIKDMRESGSRALRVTMV